MTKGLKITLAAGVALLGLYSLLRLGFLIVNRAYFADAAAGEIALAFLHGLRFDVAGLILINVPTLLLLHMPLPTVKPTWFKRMTFGVFALSNVVGVLLNLVDYGYYPMVQRRTTFEPFSGTDHIAANVPGWLEAFPALVFGGLAALGLFSWMLARFARWLDRRFDETPGWVRSHVVAVLVFGLCVLGVRGGLQDGILRPTDAFAYSPSTAVGNLTLNSTYSVILNAFLPKYEVIHAMDDAEARRVVQDMVFQPGEEALAAEYPFVRRTLPEGAARLLNVVILIQESWTWANIGPWGAEESCTPEFDKLAKDGALFTNFLATGQRSNEAVPSIVASVPSLFRRPVIGSQVEIRAWRGLGTILGEHGYTSSFHYGAPPTIEGFRGFLGLVGFDEYVCNEDFESDAPDAETHDGSWGIFDHQFYVDTVRRLDARQGPFACVTFGLAPHDPYHVPPSLAERFPDREGETGYQRALRYSDYALGRFFEEARSRPWFDKTIFFITADHTRFAPPDSLYESFHIPLLVYAPGIVDPQVRPEIASHVDILPTILDLLRLPTAHASMGRSVFDVHEPRHAVVQRGGRYAIFGDEHAYLHDLRSDLGVYAYRDDPKFRRDLAAEMPDVQADLRHKLRAWLQAVTTAVVKDRIQPAATQR